MIEVDEVEQPEVGAEERVSGAPRPSGRALDEEAIKALRRALRVRGWNQAELAERAHVKPATITRLITGGSVSAKTLEQVARALGEGRVNRDVARLLDGDIE